MNKLAELKKITDKINREAKKKSADAQPIAFIAAGNEDLLDFGLIPTGNTAIDAALGGGFPRGSIVQVIGQEGTGKTCMAFDMIAYNQKVAREKGEQFITIYVHLEARAFPLVPAVNAGVDLDQLLIINALSSAEKTFDILLRYLWDWDKRQSQNLIDLVVIDSITAAAPEAEMKSAEESLANATVGRHAAMMSKALRILSGSGALGNSLLFLINQYRTNVGGYGDPRVATGGKALGYYPKISISVTKPKAGTLKEGKGDNEVIIGHTVDGSVDKNNTQIGRPHAKFEYPVIYGKGVDLFGPVIDIALRTGVIETTSPGRFQLHYKGLSEKLHGRDNLDDRIKGDPDLFAWIQKAIVDGVAATTEESAPVIGDSDEESVVPDLQAADTGDTDNLGGVQGWGEGTSLHDLPDPYVGTT